MIIRIVRIIIARRFIPLLLTMSAANGMLVHRAAAQSTAIIAGDGWEAFPDVEYQGGDATQLKKRWGILVLTDSTLALHACSNRRSVGGQSTCTSGKDGRPFTSEPYWQISLKSLTAIASSSKVTPAGAGAKLLLGQFASDADEEFIGFVYESATSAEAPVFKTAKTQAGAIEAKVRFRLKKAGLQIEKPE